MHTCEKPIGILDSGIGGFSVARAVQRLLPEEELLYFGDGAHIPYGNHGAEEITAMARYMFAFMQARGVKALLVACNTISCVLGQCRDAVSCPVFNAVQAGADAVAEIEVGKVGVISTVFTHNSRIYPKKILERSPKKVVVLSCGCPDLARLVEHNLDDPAGMAQVEEELQKELGPMVERDGIQCCVLGCTHYPLVAGSIRKLYPGLRHEIAFVCRIYKLICPEDFIAFADYFGYGGIVFRYAVFLFQTFVFEQIYTVISLLRFGYHFAQNDFGDMRFGVPVHASVAFALFDRVTLVKLSRHAADNAGISEIRTAESSGQHTSEVAAGRY